MRAARHRLLSTAATALVLLLTACGSSSHTTTTLAATDPTGNTVHVVMAHLAFSPTAVNAKIGQIVKWANEDNVPHNVTYVSGPVFKSSRRLAPGDKFSLKLVHTGTIHYYCTIHPWMRATISVTQ